MNGIELMLEVWLAMTAAVAVVTAVSKTRNVSGDAQD